MHHHAPSWVPDGEIFHIRIRTSRHQSEPLTSPNRSPPLLSSVARYQETLRWNCCLFLLMPDHLHALISFPRDMKMSRIIGEWKSHHRRTNRVLWQDNFFDHRLRNPAEHLEKHLYILNNPVAKGLCANAADWPWVFPASDPRVERAVPAR
jgi:putative transposase